MRTIVYASLAARAMTEADLADLLAVARERNDAAGLTGLLLHAHDSFLQQLEGEEEALAETFARIEADDRHSEIRVLSERPIENRRFPEWTMGFEHPDTASLSERFSGYASPGEVKLPSFELIFDAEVAEALLTLYAFDLRR